MSRSDFRYDDTKGDGPEHLYLLEVNTQPGMTPLSLAPEQAKHVGISFRALVSWMVRGPIATPHLEAVTASHLARNAASGRVMDKCGMRLLRTERRSHRGGAPEEFCVRGITHSAWTETIL